jgi:formylglycine-generating enzyme required for sulfatase activity
MSSLADLSEIIGFFSSSREDDEASDGTLSALRVAIQRELSAQLGRSRQTFRLWQDQEAIAPGRLWESEIKAAVEQAVFFIPIVTPRAINSRYCKFEFEAFLAREHALGRSDLVFPLLYIRVPALETEAEWRKDPLLSIIGLRQYVDWRRFRHADIRTTAVREAIEHFCENIVEALREPWVSPEERRKQQEIDAQQLASVSARRTSGEQGRPEERAAEHWSGAKADLITKRAHQIWEAEGHPEGRAEEIWSRAVAELAAEEAQKTVTSPATSGPRDEVAPPTGPARGERDADADRPDLAAFRDAPFAPELVVVPAGEFMMGSRDDEEGGDEHERPRHRVTIARSFAIGRYPVTFEEYVRFCVAKQRKKPDDQGWGRKRRPVINVSWDDAQAYIAWLSQKTGKVYRLPSEAEWEYACRAGTTTRYSFGDVITPENANYADSGLGRTSEVGASPANGWGLQDTHGNAWEWVDDDWHENYRGAPNDGSAWKDAKAGRNPRRCVLRGGSWFNSPGLCRSAYRVGDDPVIRNNRIGFRVARTLS